MRIRLPVGERGVLVIDIGPTSVGSQRTNLALNGLRIDLALHAHLKQPVMQNLQIGIGPPALRGIGKKRG